MSDRPIVTASHHESCEDIRTTAGVVRVIPGVTVEVTFALHDHEAALAVLERAVADVRSQIEETT